MRLAVLLLAAAGLAPALIAGAGAFNAGSVAARTIQVSIATDANAYLSLAANAASPHDCFVDVSAGGKASITFDTVAAGCSEGTGTGIAQGDGSDAAKYSRFAFHDILTVTNKGTKPILFWVNATTTSAGGSSIEVAKRPTSGAMSDGDYAATSATSETLAVGAIGYVGVRVKTGTLISGNNVQGAVSIDARR